MTTPAIPSKPTSLSNLIETGSIVTDITSTNARPVSANNETTHIVSKPKVRPQVPPKPEGLVVKPITRRRAETVSVPLQKVSNDITPPIIPRRRVAPPKPPRHTSSSELSDDREYDEEECDEEEYDKAMNDIPSSNLCEEEYDLTPYQFNTDQTPTSNNLHNIISHRFAARTMSYPQTSATHQSEQIIIIPHQVSSNSTIESYHEYQAKHLPLFKGMTLAELTKKYSKFFPFKIQITEGHYGTSSKYSISTDDRFNLHFMKNMKQLTIQAYGEDYFIPLSSAIQFGVVYDPNDNMTEALEGHIFRRVSDLIGAIHLPRLVRVMSACSCSNDVTLEYNEMLVVKKVKRGLFNKSKPMLKVFSLLTETKKLLPEEAIANFTTKPYCVKMDLSHFLQHVQKRLPIKAVMYYDKKEDEQCVTDEEELPPNLFTWPVLLKEVKKHKSLVATLEKGSQLIDIPLHGIIGAVKANIVPPNSPADIEELFKTTESHLRHFDVTQIDTYGDFSTESAYDTQNTLYRMVHGSIKDLGIEVITPEALRKLQQHLKQDTTDDCDEDSFTSSNSRCESPVYDTLPGNEISDEGYQIVDQVWSTTISSLPDQLENQTLEIDRHVPIPTPRKRMDASSSGSGVFRFSKRSSLVSTNETTSMKQRSVSLLQLPSTDSPTNDHEENRKYIKSLSIAQVSELLDNMNLGKYKKAFMEEMISGVLLADLKENMLRDDLGVKSDLHRLRLMQIIRGEPSSHRLLKGSPSYHKHNI